MTISLKTFNILLVGGKCIGKTSFILKYLTNEFYVDLHPLGHIQLFSKCIKIQGHNIRFNIWDINEPERFKDLLPQYGKGKHSIFFFYDISNIKSFKALKKWLEFSDTFLEEASFIIIGTKFDLAKERKIRAKDVENLLTRYRPLSYIEVSSKTGKNIEKPFNILIDHFFERTPPIIGKEIKKYGEINTFPSM